MKSEEGSVCNPFPGCTSAALQRSFMNLGQSCCKNGLKICTRGKKLTLFLVPYTTVTIVTLPSNLVWTLVINWSILIVLKGELRDLFCSNPTIAYFVQLLLVLFHTLSLLVLQPSCFQSSRNHLKGQSGYFTSFKELFHDVLAGLLYLSFLLHWDTLQNPTSSPKPMRFW